MVQLAEGRILNIWLVWLQVKQHYSHVLLCCSLQLRWGLNAPGVQSCTCEGSSEWHPTDGVFANSWEALSLFQCDAHIHQAGGSVNMDVFRTSGSCQGSCATGVHRLLCLACVKLTVLVVEVQVVSTGHCIASCGSR